MEDNTINQACISLMEKAPAVYLTTLDETGYPQTRAMLNLRNREQYPGQVHLFSEHQQDLMIYFSTNTSSQKLKQIKLNPRVSVYFCDPGNFHGVMLGGDIEILDDVGIRHAIWNDGWERYYPEGPDDPDHTVLRLYPRVVRGWQKGAPFTFNL